MGRKKKLQVSLSDDDSSNSERDGMEPFEVDDDLLQEEMEGFSGHRKRRRKFTKEDAMLGIWAEDHDDSPRSRQRYKKDISFVSSSVNQEKDYSDEDEKDVNMGKEDDEIEDTYRSSSDEEEDDDEEQEQKPRIPRRPVQSEDEDDNEAIGGLGARVERSMDGFLGFNQPNGSSSSNDNNTNNNNNDRMNLDSHPSLFSSAPASPLLYSQNTAPTFEDITPMKFGSTKGRKDKLSQLRQESAPSSPMSRSRSGSSTPPVQNVGKDFAKFNAHSSGFAQKYLEKFGWQPGMGIGRDGVGMSEPIEVKLRPVNMGIGFKGFKEKTEQVVREEIRKKKLAGEIASDEDDDKSGMPKTIRSTPKREAWKKEQGVSSAVKSKKSKTKFKTADQIMQEAENTIGTVSSTPTKIIDMTSSSGPREITSITQLRASTPTYQETTSRLPELRHNLRLIVDMAQADLENLTREKRITESRHEGLVREQSSLSNRILDEEQRVVRVEEVKALCSEMIEAAKELNSSLESLEDAVPDISSVFATYLTRFETTYREEYDANALDSVIIACIHPLLRRKWATWKVLDNPLFEAASLLRWRPLLKTNDDMSGALDQINKNENIDMITKRYRPAAKPNSELTMTAFEGLIWKEWLPKVRSAVNNTWNPRDCDPVIALLETWKPPLLPLFIHENIIDQLVLPKLTREVSDWDHRRDPVMIHTWLHPWLPIIKSIKLKPLFEIVRHKFTTALRDWHPSDLSPIAMLIPWKLVFSGSEMEQFLLKNVYPKLISVLNNEFVINPAAQVLQPLEWVLAWRDLISPILMAQLLENVFFPKWLDMLARWLNSPTANYDEIVQWYTWWKGWLPQDLVEISLVKNQFNRGVDMMNQVVLPANTTVSSMPSKIPNNSTTTQPHSRAAISMFSEVTFKDIVEQEAQVRNMFFLPTNRTHEGTGRPLFRFGGTAASGGATGGVLVYVDNAENLVFVQDMDGKWMPTNVDGLVERVQNKGKTKKL